jgi:hypothetical protein
MSANAIDLTTVARVKGWLQSNGQLPVWSSGTVEIVGNQILDAAGHTQQVYSVTGNAQTGGTIPTFNDAGGKTTDNNVTWQDQGFAVDQMIQDCITAAGLYWLWRTGRLPNNGDVPTASPFVSPQVFTENYNGNGSAQMFLRQRPIQSVASLTINGNSIPQSTSLNMQGWRIADDGKSLYLISGGGGANNFFNTVTWGAWGCGLTFTKGIQNIQITYTAGYSQVPFDVELECRKMVALNWKKSNWIGQKSQAMAQGAGTIAYGDWDIDPITEKVMAAYTPTAVA